MSNKASRREKGYRDTLVWLSPEAVTALERLKLASPGQSASAIISQLLVGAGPVPAAGPVAEPHVAAGMVLSHGISPVLSQTYVADIERRLGDVEAVMATMMSTRLPAVDAELKSRADQDFYLMDKLSTLYDRVELLETPPITEPIKQKSTEPIAGRSKYDAQELVSAIVDAMIRDGGDFKLGTVHRELLAAGVAVHPALKNFWNFWNSRRDSIDAMVATRRADGVAE